MGCYFCDFFLENLVGPGYFEMHDMCRHVFLGRKSSYDIFGRKGIAKYLEVSVKTSVLKSSLGARPPVARLLPSTF